jgi:hypothetical protein
VWTTEQWATALPEVLKYFDTYALFQSKNWIDYADNTSFSAPGYNYTPVKG